MRAARAGRADIKQLLTLLDADFSPEGPVTMLAVAQERAEEITLELVREHGLRALDAWHIAAAQLALPTLVEKDEEIGFASRDETQATVAKQLGFTHI